MAYSKSDDAEVYSPAEDTFLLSDILEREQLAGKDVLEVGCGSGYLTAIAAKKGARTVAVDINPAAVEATKRLLRERNLAANVFLSDLFENVHGKFDVIVFNPPYLPEDEEDALAGSDRRYSGGKTGRETIEKFMAGAGRRLKPRGRILLLISSLTGEQEIISEFVRNGFAARAIARKKLDWEELVVIEAAKK